MTAVPQQTPPQVDPRQRALLLTVRQALLLVLAALEDYMDMPRSAEPRKERREQRERDRMAVGGN